MPQSAEPQWQPISQLPLLASIVDEMFKDTQDQYQLYVQARKKPHVLDDAIVDRASRAHQTQLEDVSLFEQQFVRWQKEPLTDPQQRQINRLTAKLASLKDLCANILAVLDEIKPGTIDAILRKSELELGLEVLLRKHKR